MSKVAAVQYVDKIHTLGTKWKCDYPPSNSYNSSKSIFSNTM